MTNTNCFERRTTSQLDTAVRSLSTLRRPTRAEGDGTEARTILSDVQHAVRAATEAGLRRVASPQSNLAFQPRVLLSLLVYCYVTGVYSSADIEDMMRRDVNFRQLCRGEFPSARVLKRFRKDNRTVVRDCIHVVLQRRAQRYRPSDGDGDVDADGGGDGGGARSSDELQGEADGRILKAMFIDSMEDEYD